MKPMSAYISSLLFILMFCPVVRAQNKIDSLLILVKTSPADSVKVKLLGEVAKQYWTSDPSRSLSYCRQALTIAEKGTAVSGQPSILGIMGIAYFYLARYDSAKVCLEKSLEMCRAMGNKKGMASACNNLGMVSRSTGDFEQSVGYYIEALKLNEDLNDVRGEASTLVNIGNVYFTQGNTLQNTEYFAKARENYEKALKIFEKLNDPHFISSCFSSIGNSILYSSFITHDTAGIRTSLEYYTRSLAIRKEMGNLPGIASDYNNIANAYEQLGDNGRALGLFELALGINEQLGNPIEIAGTSLNISRIYYARGNYKKSIEMAERSLLIARQTGYKELIKDGYDALANAHHKMGAHGLAYEYRQKHSAIKDSLLNEQNSKQINEMNTKYETEKKDKELIQKDAEIVKQNAEKTQRAAERNTFIIAFGLMILLAIFIFQGYRQKKKANIEISAQKLIIEEKQKEVMDSIHYAYRIQKSLLTTEKYIEKNMNRLQNKF